MPKSSAHVILVMSVRVTFFFNDELESLMSVGNLWSCCMAALACIIAAGPVSKGAVLTGTFVDWQEGGIRQVGDGVNHVSMRWSINTQHFGWFYGRDLLIDSDVAYAPGVRSINQITNASSLPFTRQAIGPYGDAAAAADGGGDFIVWRHATSGHMAVLRIDDIDTGLDTGPNLGHDDDLLQGRWWYQTDGSGDFSSVPEPSTGVLIALASVAGDWKVRRFKRPVRVITAEDGGEDFGDDFARRLGVTGDHFAVPSA